MEELDLSGPEGREHLRLALEVAQAALDHVFGDETEHHGHDRLRATAVAVRRFELRTGRRVLVHPLVRRTTASSA